MSERRQPINLAYPLLGSLAEAEDAVQEAYARWYGLPPQRQQAIASPGAWLTTVASRICLDLLRSARARRERYPGEWLPEPLPEPAEWGGGALAGGGADSAAADGKPAQAAPRRDREAPAGSQRQWTADPAPPGLPVHYLRPWAGT